MFIVQQRVALSNKAHIRILQYKVQNMCYFGALNNNKKSLLCVNTLQKIIPVKYEVPNVSNMSQNVFYVT